MKRPRPQQSHQQPNRPGKAGLIALSLLLAAGMQLAGCSQSSTTTAPAPPAGAPAGVPAPGAQPVAPPVKQEAPAAIEVPKETQYAYNPAGRRDPFAPIIEREEKKEKSRAIPPLERFELKEFKLTGILWGGFGYNAMIEAPDGKGYFIRTGTVLGQRRGVVKKITKDSLFIVESFKNAVGVTEQKEFIIKLQNKQEGLP